MTDNIYWVLKAQIGEGKLEELKRLSEECCGLTACEPGAMVYEWSLAEDSRTLHICERYADSEAALAHMANLSEQLPKLMELVSVTGIEVYGAASDSFREATKGMPISYMEGFCGFRK